MAWRGWGCSCHHRVVGPLRSSPASEVAELVADKEEAARLRSCSAAHPNILGVQYTGTC